MHLFLYLFIYLFRHLFIPVCIDIFIHVFIYLFIYLFILMSGLVLYNSAHVNLFFILDNDLLHGVKLPGKQAAKPLRQSIFSDS